MTSPRPGLGLSLCVSLLVGCADTAPPDPGSPGADLETIAGKTTGVRVMTQNMYVGYDVFPIMTAAPDQLPLAVAQAWADFVANRPEDRMAAIATEIALTRPHLVGLQEVAELFEQSPSDTVLGNFTPNAADLYVDFLAVLQDELAARGVTYEVAARQVSNDSELPRFDGVVDGAPTFSDVRTRFSDVILRRADVAATPLFAVTYAAALPIPILPGAAVRRGAVAVVATIGGRRTRFVSTHLEPLLDGVPAGSQPQLGQVSELLQTLAGGYEPALPTLVVGDFNSEASSGASYQAMKAAGFADAWRHHIGLPGQGPTCCQGVVLDHPDSRLDQRIDFVWSKGFSTTPTLASTIGDQPFFRTASAPRLWPSDHAGVIVWRLF